MDPGRVEGLIPDIEAIGKVFVGLWVASRIMRPAAALGVELLSLPRSGPDEPPSSQVGPEGRL